MVALFLSHSFFICFANGGFVVLSGFSPKDLQIAQQAQTGNPSIVYFLDNSPDYINLKGEVKTAADQVNAWAKAEGITYLAIFIQVSSC